MGQVKLPVFETNTAPALGLFGGSPSADPDGDPDAASLCLAWKGVNSSQLYYSPLPWTVQSHITGSHIAGRPAFFASGNEVGDAWWAWKDASGTTMSWAAGGHIQGVPNHAHTVSSPALLMVGRAIDPATGGINYHIFTLFWQGDAAVGSSGTAHELWSMSYATDGSSWGTPVRIPGAGPATSPAACLGPSGFNTFGATLAWNDSNGQIWLSQGDDSGDAETQWSTPMLGPSASTLVGPAVCYFHGNLIVAWTLQGLGWIMYSIQTVSADGTLTWSDPVRLVAGHTHDTPALAEFSGKLYVAWRDFSDNSISYETFAAPSDLPRSTANPVGSVVVITNTIVGYAYTGTILIGAQFDPANVIIDTGSSALAVLASKYDAASDNFLVPTTLAQYDAYGTAGETGFWFGPVIETQVALPLLPIASRVSVAIADASSARPVFAGADGILGLAYPSLNKAYDISTYLTKRGEGPQTYPWPIPAAETPPDISAFDSFIKSAGAAAVPVPPCMTQFVQEGLLPDKFALWVFRAWANQRTPTPTTDPSNSGILILGGGEDYFVGQVGPFQAVEVVADSFYCLNLFAVQVGSNPPIIAFPGLVLRPDGVSNALLDSGTAGIMLQTDLYAAVMAELNASVPGFPGVDFILRINNAALNLTDWPMISFILTGPGGTEVTLYCDPSQYWQLNARQPGLAQFMLQGLSDPSQSSVLGLTLMTGYYTIFDRSAGGFGVINFAQKPLM